MSVSHQGSVLVSLRWSPRWLLVWISRRCGIWSGLGNLPEWISKWFVWLLLSITRSFSNCSLGFFCRTSNLGACRSGCSLMHSRRSEHSWWATSSRSDRHGASTGRWLLDGYGRLCHWSLFYFRRFLRSTFYFTLLRTVRDLLRFNFGCFFLVLAWILVRVNGLIKWADNFRQFHATCLLWVIFFLIQSWGRLNWILVVQRILNQLRVLHILRVLTSWGNIRHSLTKHAFKSTEVSTTTITLILIHLGDRLALLIGHSHWLWNILNRSSLLLTVVFEETCRSFRFVYIFLLLRLFEV